MIRIFFLVRSLEAGGAERQLIELVRGMNKSRFAVTLATFYSGGALRGELDSLQGVRVLSLNKRGRWDVIPFMWRLWRAARHAGPQIIYSSMGVSNELALPIGRAVGAKVAWSLRTSNVDFSRYSRLSLWSFRAASLLSNLPDLIIANSYAGKEYYIAHGYSGKRMIVIPNGVNTEKFRPDPEARVRVRREWGIAEDEPLVGLVGRLDPAKGHPTFIRAAALLTRQEGCRARFVCVGDGPEPYHSELRSLASELGLEGNLIWAGARSDMPLTYNAFDVVCSSSDREGMPNAIAEAMSCGVPCVVTDVGDSARLVGRPDLVVPPREPEALAAALGRLLKLPPVERSAIGEQARDRVMHEYSVARLARTAEDALLKLLK